MQQSLPAPHLILSCRARCSAWFPAALCLAAGLFPASAVYSAPLYQGYNHRVLQHVKTVPAGSLAEQRPTLAENGYGPDSTADTVQNNSATKSPTGRTYDLFNTPKDYGIRENLKP